ncbi:MAG: anthranilate synthase component I family protein [Acidobacteriota bacterium]|nr:anthranilate synthase component I family protein [Blastocatellia bacterium]MDW8412424.1 anthranilate synthase component I family protein [Acidobacteriota bacterium]
MTYRPKNYEEFAAYASTANVIPVSKKLPSDMLTPVAAYLKLRGAGKRSFLLESIEGNERISRYSFIGVDPYLVIKARGENLEYEQGDGIVSVEKGDIFTSLSKYLASFVVAKVPDMPPFVGGGVGYIGYDAIRSLERLGGGLADDLGIYDSVVMFFSAAVIFDHVKQSLLIVAGVFVSQEGASRQLYESALATISDIENVLFGVVPAIDKTTRTLPPAIRSNVTKEGFESAVEKIRVHIREGEILQATLSVRVVIDNFAPAFQLYRAIRTLSPAPYMFYLDIGEYQLMGASYDMLLRCTGRRLDYRIAAGSCGRGATDVEDLLLAEELRADEKKVAEHTLAVDLARGDLGRVCDYGSIELFELMIVEKYSQMMQMVSSIKGRLANNKTSIDALAACLPAAKVSGAPKLRAIKLMDELENTRRGPYAGVILYLDYSRNLDSCITISTVICKQGQAYAQAGESIVADSVPDKKYLETINKVRLLLKSVEIAEKEI